MKPILVSLLCCSAVFSIPAQTLPPVPAPAAAPVPGQYAVAERSAHQRVWRKTTFQTNALGQVRQRVHSYTELATGLVFMDPATGEWRDTSTTISLLPGGFGAAATNGPHKLYLPANLYEGAIEVISPDGVRQISRPWGISYFDGTNNVLIAELKSCLGQVLPSGTKAIYEDAFADLKANIIVTYKRSGIECDLVFRARPPAPADYHLPDNSRLQLLTEFFDTPDPVAKSVRTDPATGLTDTRLAFGRLTMKPGKAFSVGDPPPAQGARRQRSILQRPAVRVSRSWLKLPDPATHALRTFLLEEVPYPQIKPQFDRLSAVDRPAKWLAQAGGMRHRVASSRLLSPARPPRSTADTIELAQVDATRQPGVLWDYEEQIGEDGDFTFQGDTTYYISGPFGVATATIAGGTVIKYYDDPENEDIPCIEATGCVCKTDKYRPAVFTSANDCTIGDPIDERVSDEPYGSFDCLHLYPDLAPPTLSYLHFRYGWGLVASFPSSGAEIKVANSQFINCGTAIFHDPPPSWHYAATFKLQNLLATGCDFLVDDSCSPVSVQAEHVTLDGNAGYASLSGHYTNSILIGIADFAEGTVLDHCLTNATSAGLFQTVGAGSYYLADNSPYRNAGTTNIDSTLLADLRKMTTYPPILLSNVIISTDTTLAPQAQRDTDRTDIGYHYQPLDYLFCQVSITNATVLLTPGTVMAGCSYDPLAPGCGLSLLDGAKLHCYGSPANPNRIISFLGVQEPSNTNCFDGGVTIVMGGGGTSLPTEACFHFTHWCYSSYQDEGRNHGTNYRTVFTDCEFHLADCENYGGGIFATNCLFAAGNLCNGDQHLGTAKNVVYRNCLFLGCYWAISHEASTTWTFQDNLFDQTTLDQYGTITASYNGYTPGSDRLTPTNANDVVASVAYRAGPLGDYYQPTNSAFINHGSTNADLVGLYHYTTTTNLLNNVQIKETNSVVDIGYHYVALDANWNPIDTDSDGIADYLEDANGNGTATDDPTSWLSYDSPNGLTSGTGLQVFTPLK